MSVAVNRRGRLAARCLPSAFRGCALSDFDGVPTIAQYRAGLARWLDEHGEELAPYRGLERPSLEQSIEGDRRLLALLHEAGWNRWGWPVDAGGRGGTAVLRGALYDQLYASGYRIAEAMLPLETIAPALLAYAPELAARFLPAALRGDEVWCQGFSEPDAGSDLASLRCRAVDAGDHWVVTGQKIWTSWGHVARRCILLARTGPAASAHHGLTMLFADMDSPGVTARPIRAITGRNEFAEVFFAEAPVPKDRLVGEVDKGWAVAMHLLQWERGMYAWQRQAWLHSRLGQLIASASEIRPSGEERIGEAYEAVFALRARCGDTLRRLAAGENPGPEISVDKILLATAEQTVLDVAREALHPVVEVGTGPESEAWRSEWFFSRAASVYGGAAEIQRTILAERLLGLPREAERGR